MSIALKTLVAILIFLGLTPLLRPFLMSILRRTLPKRRYVKLAEMIRRKKLDYTNGVWLEEEEEENYPLMHLGVSAYEAYITAQTILSVGKNYKLNDEVVKISTDALKRAIKVSEATSDHETIPELLPKIRKAFENMAEFGVSVDEAFVKDSSDLLDRYNKLSEDLRNRTDEDRAHDLIVQMQRTHAVPDLDS